MGAAAKLCVSVRSSTSCAGTVKESAFGAAKAVCPAATEISCAVPDNPAFVLLRLMVCVPAAAAVPLRVTVAMTTVFSAWGLALSKRTVAVTPF